jgi:transcriptional regulator with GAF, ATPase, and Fis domain/tetratricopeptide (TPR) repeat protein
MSQMAEDILKSADLLKTWQRFSQSDKEIVLYFAYAPQPVSVDTLSSFSNTSAVNVLNVMEKLRRKGIVCEKKAYGRGLYFPTDENLIAFLRDQIKSEGMAGVAKRIIEHSIQPSLAGDERTVLLADLYSKISDSRDGLATIKNAADILGRSGEKLKAAAYYEHVVRHFSDAPADQSEAELFLDSVIGMIYVMMHRMPLAEQITLLTRAEVVARHYEMWDRLARISLWLGRALQDAGQDKKASKCINDFLALADKIPDPAMLKATSLAVAEYFVWKGNFLEAARRYEEIVGELEEFGDNEMVLLASNVLGMGHALSGRISRGLGMIDAVRIKARHLNLQEVVNYSDQASAVVLLEIRKIPEAEFFVNRLSTFSADVLGPFMAEALCDFKAFILCAKEDYEGAFQQLKKRQQLIRTMGRIHNPAAWSFETLSILESKGYSLDELNITWLINKMLDWDDIYMKGVALRYRALRNGDRQQPSARVLADLLNSEKHLKRSGAEIELARTRIALGKYYLASGETKTARLYLSRAWEFFSTVDRNLFPEDLLDAMPQEQRVEFMVERVTRINESLGTIHDMSSFLEKVINVAMDFTMAMRGAFVVRESNELKLIAARNLDRSLFYTDKFKRVREFITGTIDAESELVLPQMNASVELKAPEPTIDALICMPAKLGDEILGYLCLDGRVAKDPFPSNQIPFVRMLCSQIAVGLSNIRIYEELKEQRDRFENEAVFYKREMGIVKPTDTIIGSSASMKAVLDQIHQVAPTDSSVLVLGETGVGKELVAKAIHNLSGRSDGPFIPVNLAALPQELIASELFGHEKGAFTGANDSQRGRFELADGGTIFLDEIGDLPTGVQVKLLRVLQEGTFERLGSAKQVRSNFRVVAATNKDLRSEVEKGTFRQDLYYRLNVFPVYIPPLRERREDITPLTRHFLEKYSKKLGKRPRPTPPQELKKLLDYHWPGNVRELEHFIERAVILSDGYSISFSGLRQNSAIAAVEESPTIRPLEEIEREYIKKALNATGWRVSGPRGAASLLGFKTSTLRFRMEKLGIKKPTAG